MSRDEQFSEEQLNAFVDGELDAEDKSQLLIASESSEELDQRLCQQRKLKELVKHSYEETPQPRRMKPAGRIRTGLLGQSMVASILVLVGAAIGFFAQRNNEQQFGLEDWSRTVLSQPMAAENYILHVVSGDPEQMFAALQKAQALLDSAEPGQLRQVEVVANEAGLNLLRSDVTPFASEILALQRENVIFYACSRTIERLEDEGVEVQLVPDARYAYTALDRVVIRMKDGWEYIKI